jgi:Trypsin-co-occurring domain 1
MLELVRFPLEVGGSLLVEVEPEPGLRRAARPGEMLREASASLERALHQVRDAASAAMEQFLAMPRRPDELEIKFGLKLDAQAGAVIARTGLQGQFEVKLKWIRDGATPAAEEPPAEP